ncbi:hypothetical protein [Rubrimonas cliftonensis]|uniref:Serine/threonine protein phosphatase PrpC n=1 Tax=Rubrimonas cliftonensis TaxID=89524 RepID=A0A1H3VGI9_9RHOB|nr:hypothetical protein [Rubrimonas cliftonensis]SDZ73334.1 Serine/threonine protein phosphatase PrpC [Rubrimonas cliftonensis]
MSLVDRNIGNAFGDWSVEPTTDLKLFPPSRSDHFLPYQIRLPVELTDDDMAAIDYDGDGSLGATVFGPEQEKHSNQDFCVCGAIADDRGRRLSFSVVCDGVSTGAFWTQRGAQVASFSAYAVLKQMWREGMSSAERITEAHVEAFRERCAERIAAAIKADRSNLLYDVHGYPPDFAARVFLKNRDGMDVWHHSTIIVAAVAHNGGLIAFAGDGGVSLLRRSRGGEESVRSILRSTDDLAISKFVSPMVRASDIAAGVIDTTDVEHVQITTCSDGVDRTLSKADVTLEAFAGEFGDSEALAAGLEALPSRFGEFAERDNYALAIIAWPRIERPAASGAGAPEAQSGAGQGLDDAGAPSPT